MIDMSNAFALDITTRSWRWAVPSYWFARGWKFFSRFETGWEDLLGAAILLIVPVFSIWFVVKYLAPSFARKLASLGVSADEGNSSKKSVTLHVPSGWKKLANRMATLLTKGPEERVGFLIVWNLSGRLRDFKMKVYPGIGYIVVIIGFSIYNTFRRIEDVDSAIQLMNTGLAISVIYASGLLLLTAVNQLQFSDNFKASWFYLVAPVGTPGHIISGAIKAAIAKFYVPVVIIVSALVIYFFGLRAVPNLILGFSNVILSCLIISQVTFRSLPFSSAQSSANQTGMMLRTFGCMAIAGLIGVAHYFIYSFIPVVLIGIVLSVVACWLVLGSIKKRNWSSIRASYDI
jgi:hypothetical protein